MEPPKNYDKPGIFPENLVISNIQKGEFEKTIPCNNPYEGMEPTFQMVFDYSFEFVYINKIIGTAFVYRGGFYIEYKKPYGHICKPFHYPGFAMPSCQHFTKEGSFTQFFIGLLKKELDDMYDYLIEDEIATTMHYMNQRKGH